MPALNLEDAVQINIKEAQMNMGMITIAKIPSALIALGQTFVEHNAKGTSHFTQIK